MTTPPPAPLPTKAGEKFDSAARSIKRGMELLKGGPPRQVSPISQTLKPT